MATMLPISLLWKTPSRALALACATCLALACGGTAAQAVPPETAQPEVEVSLSRAKGYPLFDVATDILVDADVQRCWDVLTDYNRLAEFVPNLSTSHLVSSKGNERVVAQTGFVKLLFIRQAVDLTLEMTEQPLQSISMRLLSGNMHEYQARWELKPLENGRTHISYAGVMAPDFYVPTLFGAALMKSDLRDMLNAVRAEIEKRPDKN